MIYFIFYLFAGLVFALGVSRYVKDGNERMMFVLNFLFWPVPIILIVLNASIEGIALLIDLMIRLSRIGRKE